MSTKHSVNSQTLSHTAQYASQPMETALVGGASKGAQVPSGVAPPKGGTLLRTCHDMRQPIATILMLATAASLESGTPPRVQQYLDEITGQATWISDMVHTILHHAPTVEPEVVNVVDVTKRVVAIAAASGVTAVIELLAAPSVFAFVDRVLVGRAIANLVDNATRAAGPDGHVRLSVRSRGPAVVVIVEDDGPGFGEAPCGTGLGLSMTAFVASTCGGQLALKASRLGGGKVTLTLPRTPPRSATTS